MNEKFFTLPEEKQQEIVDAGFRVFSENSYKKSPVRQVAAKAGISKSLLFHYFQNKKELYLFLWDKCAAVTIDYLEQMYRQMYWASEGYLWELVQQGELDVEQMEKDFREMIVFWKQVYLRKEVSP